MAESGERQRPRLNLKPRDEAAAAKIALERAASAKVIGMTGAACINFCCPGSIKSHFFFWFCRIPLALPSHARLFLLCGKESGKKTF